MNTIIDKLYKKLDKEFVTEFIRLVNIKCTPLRKPKYSIEYYLYHIVLVLTDLQTWKSLELLHPNNYKNHYKTIQDKHLEWSKKNLYELTYKQINKKYHQDFLKCSSNLTLFIDSTNIYNKNGQEQIGYGQNPKKQESRISAICDINKNIYSLILVKSINKTNNKKTMPHDSKTIEPSLNNLLGNGTLNTNLKYNNINLVGDKGYATKINKKQEIKSKYNVNIVYPHKQNQKIKTPKSDKTLLKDRYVIENVFATLKSYDRICIRKDKLECTFMGFVYLGAMLTFKK